MSHCHATVRALTDAELGQWSDNAITKQCNVSPNFVGTVRRSISSEVSEKSETSPKRNTNVLIKNDFDTAEGEKATERTFKNKHGKTTKMKVG